MFDPWLELALPFTVPGSVVILALHNSGGRHHHRAQAEWKTVWRRAAEIWPRFCWSRLLPLLPGVTLETANTAKRRQICLFWFVLAVGDCGCNEAASRPAVGQQHADASLASSLSVCLRPKMHQKGSALPTMLLRYRSAAGRRARGSQNLFEWLLSDM